MQGSTCILLSFFSGTLKKNKDVEVLPPYEVAVAPEIVSQMEDCLKGMEITPVDTSTYKGGEGAESLSLLSTATFDHLFPESRPGGVNAS